MFLVGPKTYYVCIFSVPVVTLADTMIKTIATAVDVLAALLHVIIHFYVCLYVAKKGGLCRGAWALPGVGFAGGAQALLGVGWGSEAPAPQAQTLL